MRNTVYRAVWECTSLCLLGLGFDLHLRSSSRKITLILAANFLLAEDDKFHVYLKRAILRDK
jgi:hypothetical protein